MSVFDKMNYVNDHNNITAPDTTIIYFTDTGIMIYPSSHSMSFFEAVKDNNSLMVCVSQYGDKLVGNDFAALLSIHNNELMVVTITKNLLSIKLINKVNANQGGGAILCGSPCEVAPNPTLDSYFDVVNSENIVFKGCLNSYGKFYKQKKLCGP